MDVAVVIAVGGSGSGGGSSNSGGCDGNGGGYSGSSGSNIRISSGGRNGNS